MPPNCTLAIRIPCWWKTSVTLPGIARHISCTARDKNNVTRSIAPYSTKGPRLAWVRRLHLVFSVHKHLEARDYITISRANAVTLHHGDVHQMPLRGQEVA